jgi:hypothetical protein
MLRGAGCELRQAQYVPADNYRLPSPDDVWHHIRRMNCFRTSSDLVLEVYTTDVLGPALVHDVQSQSPDDVKRLGDRSCPSKDPGNWMESLNGRQAIPARHVP